MASIALASGHGKRGALAASFILAAATLAGVLGMHRFEAAVSYALLFPVANAAVGVMDIFRLPKFSYHFYRSQRDATEGGCNWTGGPCVFIASHWTAASSLQMLVFSNCEAVMLHLNGRVVGRADP